MLKLSKARLRRILIVGLSLLTAVAVTGCRTIKFYAQAVKGQYQLISSREPIPELMKSPDTDEKLKKRFIVVGEIRRFAAQQLALPVDGHYNLYADLHRPYVVWNVEAAREFSMEPKRWWYPLIGRQKYRGYFSRSAATNYAASLEQNWDVFVGGVQAYSTLGWFKESVLNTFVYDPDPELAELIFHELSHQQVFARGDTDFNEAFATTVGQEGTRRWLKSTRNVEVLEAYERDLAHNAQFVALVMKTRRELEELFGDERTEEGEVKATHKRFDIAPVEMRRRKAAIYERLKDGYAQLKAEWGGDASYDGWFTRRLNNAKLNSIAAYYDLVPGFQALLEVNGGDLKKFYASAQGLADMPRKKRREWLRTLELSEPLPQARGAGDGLVVEPSRKN